MAGKAMNFISFLTQTGEFESAAEHREPCSTMAAAVDKKDEKAAAAAEEKPEAPKLEVLEEDDEFEVNCPLPFPLSLLYHQAARRWMAPRQFEFAMSAAAESRLLR